MKNIFIIFSSSFALLFFQSKAQNYNSKVYYDTYNNITKYYEKPAATNNYNYNTPSYNNNTYTPSYNSNYDNYKPADNYNYSGNNSNSSSSTAVVIRTSSDFSGSTVSFCEKVEGGKALGVYSNFTLSPSGGVVNIYISLPVSVNSTEIYMQVQKYDPYKLAYPNPVDGYNRYKQMPDKKEYDYYYVERVSQKTEPSYTMMWNQYDFSKFGPGFYKFDVYTYEGVFITTGKVEIKPAN